MTLVYLWLPKSQSIAIYIPEINVKMNVYSHIVNNMLALDILMT